MAAANAKKTSAKKESDEPTETDVAEDEQSEQGVRENNPAGVHDALKGPTTADLNPAFN